MAIVKKPSVAIVGVGRLGSAMLRELTRGAYAVKETACRIKNTCFHGEHGAAGR
ncbi:MAG: hypothetical protein ABSE92_10650 [Terriglobales bacterium]